VRAVYFSGFDGESIELRELPEPRQPDAREVLVRVHAAGLNRADLLQSRGGYPPPTEYSANIPGLEFAGEIVDVASNVTNWKPGDRVMAITAGEAQAEMVVIDERLLMRIPENLSFTEAAAIPEGFITAHDAVFSQGLLAPGETLLINAVGSGVGLSALQMAKTRGITVVGTSRTAEKLNRCLGFGLDHAIDTSDGPFFVDKMKMITSGRGVDVILELVGGDYFPEDVASIALKGRIVLVGLTAGSASEIDFGVTLQKRAKIIGTVLRPRDVEEKEAATCAFADSFLDLFAAGEITPVVDSTFAAERVREAYKYLASNESFGKVVIEF
jgi:NADPH2:quinone reductase